MNDDDCARCLIYTFIGGHTDKDENMNPVYFINLKAASNERPTGLSFVNNRSRESDSRNSAIRDNPPFVISH